MLLPMTNLELEMEIKYSLVNISGVFKILLISWHDEIQDGIINTTNI